MKKILEKGKQRVKGTVLFTVVTVMLVMVIFLMSTLILTTSANRRSYYTYYQTQAQYAAQAALDAITNYAYSDRTFSDWVVDTADTIGVQHDIVVNFDDTTLPLVDTNGMPTSQIVCTVELDEPNYIWDDVTKHIHEQRAWKITATAYVGSGKNRTEYQKVNYIYANVKSDDLTGNENVVDYHMYTWDQNPEETETETEITDEENPGSVARAVYTLSPTSGGTNMLTLGPQYSNMTSFPVGRMFYQCDNVPQTSIDNDTAASGNALFVNNYVSDNHFFMNFQQNSEGLVVYGDFRQLKNQVDIYADIAAAYKPTASSQWKYNQMNYVYVDGMFQAAQNCRIGMKGGSYTKGTNYMPINLYAGGVKCTEGNSNPSLAVYGDTYLYDPELDSVWAGKGSYTHLSAFTTGLVTKSDTSPLVAKVGGNLVCNNNSIKFDANDPFTIEGDFIFTNPVGTINNVNNTVKITGKMICACPEENVKGKFEAAGGIVYDANGSANVDTKYASYSYATKVEAQNNYSLFPYAYRQDEIFEEYYRWDLAFEGTSDAWKEDPLVKESIAAGHVWKTKEMTGYYNPKSDETKTETETVVTPIYDTRVEVMSNTDFQTLSGHNIWGGAYIDGDTTYTPSNQRWDGAYNDNVADVTISRKTGEETTEYTKTVRTRKVEGTEVLKTMKVPYTTPKLSNNWFIKKFNVVNPNTASSAVLTSGADYYNTLAGFTTTFTGAATKFSGGATSNFMFYYEGDKRVDGGSTDLGDVIVINEDCEINLKEYNETYDQNKLKTIFIDPTAKKAARTTTDAEGKQQVKPLAVVFSGSISNCNIQVIVNNSCSYDGAGYGEANCTAYDLTNKKYAARDEVYIFFKNGFGAAAQPLRIYTSGAFDQVKNKTFDVISNPIYPTNSKFSAVPVADQYKYQLVPNFYVFGEKDATYTFSNAFFINGEVLLADSKVSISDVTLTKTSSVSYREEYNTTAYGGEGQSHAIACLGTMMVKDLLGTNNPVTIYIGDGHRAGTRTKTETTYSDPVSSNSTGSSVKNPLVDDGKDYFNNDHMGAS